MDVKSLVIVDRDGVINAPPNDYVRTPEAWVPIEGSLEAIARLNCAGYQVAVATNQSGVGRGYYSEETLEAIHHKMVEALAEVSGKFDAIAYCPHHPEEGCGCRKPKPGMLYRLAEQLNAEIEEAMMVGDSLCDIQAAQAAGCQAVLVSTGKGEQTRADLDSSMRIPYFEDLAVFVSWFLEKAHGDESSR